MCACGPSLLDSPVLPKSAHKNKAAAVWLILTNRLLVFKWIWPIEPAYNHKPSLDEQRLIHVPGYSSGIIAVEASCQEISYVHGSVEVMREVSLRHELRCESHSQGNERTSFAAHALDGVAVSTTLLTVIVCDHYSIAALWASHGSQCVHVTRSSKVTDGHHMVVTTRW
jgi:hypothetical protein